MMKMNLEKEEICEDCCFKCKDGGDLLICDYGDCLKTYHAACIDGDTSFIDSGSSWTCEYHFCFLCKKRSKFCCFCCPKAVCQRCFEISEFQSVKGKKGFCNHCLKLALLAEENKDVDSDGEKVDFRDLETYEGLFLGYWEMIKWQEGLSLEHLQSADAQSRKPNCMSGSDPENEETDLISDYEDEDGIEKQKQMRVSKKKRYKEQKFLKKMGVKSSETEFIGWGSKPLIHFLQSIGEDTNNKLSLFEVSAIVNGYINKNKLFDPNKKKKIICDERLKCLLRKKSYSRNRIHVMLEPHLLENLQLSDEDELGYSSENQDLLVPCKKQRNMSTCKKPVEKEVTNDFLRRSLAAIVPENIKLVYLKRSLVEELLKQPEEFEKKVMESFVRVKSDPFDYFQQNSHQLVQVRGVKKTSVAENITEIHLQVSNMLKDMRISLLSDDSFTEEECEDLKRRMKDGLLQNPTVEELEKKARSLHEDITKHWIIRELDLLQHNIDKANEKGWRRELSVYLERRQLLQTPLEQARLLRQIPKVVANLAEQEPMAEAATEEYEIDESSLKPIASKSSGVLANKCGIIRASSVVEEKLQSQDKFETEQRPENDSKRRIAQNQDVSPTLLIELSSDGEDIGVAATKEEKEEELVAEEKHHCSLYVPKVEQNYSTQRSMQQYLSQKDHCQTTPKDLKPRIVQKQQASPHQLIELSSDDDDYVKEEKKDEEQVMMISKTETEDKEIPVWHCVGPDGDQKGPFSLSLLKRWAEISSYALKYKAWKDGQSKESAIPLAML